MFGGFESPIVSKWRQRDKQDSFGTHLRKKKAIAKAEAAKELFGMFCGSGDKKKDFRFVFRVALICIFGSLKRLEAVKGGT